MGVVDAVNSFVQRRWSSRDSSGPLSFTDWLSWMSFNGSGYPVGMPMTTMQGEKQETPNGSFESYIQQIFKTNGIVFACMVARMLPFAEARFQFRRFTDGRPGELFGTSALRLLEQPEPNKTTGDLLSRVIQDADLAGNHYSVRRRDRIVRLRPDWVTIVVGSQSRPSSLQPGWEIDGEVVGYIYSPGGYGARSEHTVLMPEEVAHFAPIPDPAFRFRGMSWLTPVIREVLGDSAATTHKLRFFENAATPNLVVSMDKSVTKEAFDAFLTKMKEQHEGALNAYKTLYLAGGATATVVGANMQQLDFKVTQGHGETRVAAAARIPPIIVGLSEGLDAATYSNYGQARRAFADMMMRPYWRNVAGSFAPIVNVPANAELWYDDRDIPFLREDVGDRADIQSKQALTIRTLTDSGFKPETVIKAVMNEDFSMLVHSGLYSVQLQTPGSPKMPDKVPGETPATPLAVAPAAPKALPATTESAPAKRADDPDEGELEPDSPSADGALTDREREVAKLIAAGLSNKEVGARLGLSRRTVERAISTAIAKMGVKTRMELALVIDVKHDESATGAIVKSAEATAELARSTAAAADAALKPRVTTTVVDERDDRGRLKKATQNTEVVTP